MTATRADLANAVRPLAPGGALRAEHIGPLNALADALGLPAATGPASRLTIAALHDRFGITRDTLGYGESFGPRSRAALLAMFTARNPAPLTEAHLAAAATALGVDPAVIRAVRRVEAPRGAFDDQGRPSILYERHVFRRNTVPKGHFDAQAPNLSAPTGYGPGGYGSYASQYIKLADACALDPEAALRACSWGAFQVLGENAVALGYASALDMALSLLEGEAAHLETFVRFVRSNGLVDELRACKAGNALSCVPFVSRYNGPDYATFGYHVKLAGAIK